jgi:hypothetical protein
VLALLQLVDRLGPWGAYIAGQWVTQPLPHTT